MRDQARREGGREHFGRAGVDLEALLDRLLAADPERLSPPANSDEPNTDLFPRDEYQVARP